MWQKNHAFTLSILSLPLLQTSVVFAQSLKENHDSISSIERIEVTSSIEQLNSTYVAYDQVQSSDLSDWLTSIPGANVNKNGPIVGIAQYRGLYGDRVAIKVDGQPIVGAGPNAMDTPLSYAANITSDSLTLYRGIAPVSVGIETLGGAIDVTTRQAEFSDNGSWQTTGSVSSAYATINQGSKISSFINVANESLATLTYVDSYQGNDIETASGETITPTGYDKNQAGLDTRWQMDNDSIIGLTYDYTDTQNAGTPALPMDITYIFTHRLSIEGIHELTTSTLDWKLSYSDADHEMDNYANRENNNLNGYRRNNTDAESYYYTINWQQANWQLGLDGYMADHNATITNPNNPMFEVKNFNNVEESKHSAFIQYQQNGVDSGFNAGVRVKFINADAGEVSHHMAMMNPTVGEMVNNFNQSERDQSSTDVDLTLEYKKQLSATTLLSFAAARKERAPSYQERYLWLPMEATGGLADGNTYLGDVNLTSETAYQSNIGLTYQSARWQVLADIHYQYIDDYIQGVTSTNMQAQMISSMMMNNDTVLQFTNVEASLYGAETHMIYHLTTNWQLGFQASYVRGQREDINDNLYRVAPLNGHLSLTYQKEDWYADIKLHGVAKQDKVSITNQEQKTSGYGYVDMQFAYMPNNTLTIKAGVSNLFDRDYESHLSGYNRVVESDIDVMSRFPSAGRDFWLAADYSF